MASFLCKCGAHLSNTECPNNIQYHVYSDIEWSRILEKDSILTLQIPAPENDIWRCPNCERIYIFSESGMLIKTYQLEE